MNYIIIKLKLIKLLLSAFRNLCGTYILIDTAIPILLSLLLL